MYDIPGVDRGFPAGWKILPTCVCIVLASELYAMNVEFVCERFLSVNVDAVSRWSLLLDHLVGYFDADL